MTIVKSSLVCDICREEMPSNSQETDDWYEVSVGEYDTPEEKIYDICPYCKGIINMFGEYGLFRDDVRVATKGQIKKRGY